MRCSTRRSYLIFALLVSGPFIATGLRKIFPPKQYSDPRISQGSYTPDLTNLQEWSDREIKSERKLIISNPQIWDGSPNYTLSQREALAELDRELGERKNRMFALNSE